MTSPLVDRFRKQRRHRVISDRGYQLRWKDAAAVTEHFWQLHSQPKGSWTAEVKYSA
jgi:hypothetical protein